jgi:signal transduction histidine kinase
MIYFAVEMFGNIVDTASIYIICSALFERKQGTKNSYIFVVILFQSLAMRILNIIAGNSHWVVLAALILSSYFLCRLFFHLNRFKFLLSILFFFVLIVIVEIMVTLMITSFFNIENILLANNEYRILGILSSKIITLYILIYFSKVFEMKAFKMEKYSLLTLIMIILSLTVFFVSTRIYLEIPQLGIHVAYIMGVAVIMAVISILMLFVVRKIIEATEERTRFVAIENEYKKQIEYFKKYEELSEEIKSRRHDYKNHLISILSIAKNEGSTKVVNYVDDILEVEGGADHILGINNKIMSSLINYNMNKMKKNGIVFEYDIDLSTEIHVSDVDMTIIMGNLLDNAIEACLDVEEKRRYINLDIACGYGKIDILIKNSIDGKVDIASNHLQTIKKDKENHGYGLNNIRKIVEKYNGYFKISSNNNEFIAELFI